MTKDARPDASLFDIDPNRLDEEWLGHARRVWHYAGQMPDAKAVVARAKADVKVVYAEVAMHVRQDPIYYGLSKVTDEVVKQVVPTTERHKEAVEREILAQHWVDVLQVTIDTLSDRKKGLENATTLHLVGYTAVPRARDRVSREHIERVETTNAFSRKPKKRGDGE